VSSIYALCLYLFYKAGGARGGKKRNFFGRSKPIPYNLSTAYHKYTTSFCFLQDDFRKAKTAAPESATVFVVIQ
jgi:hypothetical protein